MGEDFRLVQEKLKSLCLVFCLEKRKERVKFGEDHTCIYSSWHMILVTRLHKQILPSIYMHHSQSNILF